MDFRTMLANDMAVFFNEQELAESHKIGSSLIPVVIDSDQLEHRSKTEYEGVAVGDILIFVNAAYFSKKPKTGQMTTFDGKPVEVFDVRENAGVYEIIYQYREG